MTCAHFRRHLEVFADGELPAPERPSIEAHLRTCDGCRDQVRRWQALRAAARRVMFSQAMPAALPQRVTAVVSAARRAQWRRRWAGGAGFAAAAALMLAVLLWRSGGINPPSAPGSSESAAAPARMVNVAELGYVCRACAFNRAHDGLHVAGHAPQDVQTTLAERVRFGVLVPDLSAAGYTLAGACRCFPDPSASVVHTFYRDASNRALSVFSIQGRAKLASSVGSINSKTHAKSIRIAGPRTYQQGSDQGLNVLLWRSRGVSYAVCARMTADELFRLVDSESFDVACRVPSAIVVMASAAAP